MSIDDQEDFEFAVEDRFRATFGRVGRITADTPKALLDALVRDGAANPVSVLQRAFYRVRHVLAVELAIPPVRIRPDTLLAALLPDRTTRRAHWLRIVSHLGARDLPRLERPLWLERLLLYPVAVGWLVVLCVSIQHVSVGGAFLFTTIGIVGLGTVVLRLTRRWCVEFRPNTLNAGILARYLTAYGAQALDLPDDQWTRGQAKEILSELMRLELDVDSYEETTEWSKLQPAGVAAP